MNARDETLGDALRTRIAERYEELIREALNVKENYMLRINVHYLAGEQEFEVLIVFGNERREPVGISVRAVVDREGELELAVLTERASSDPLQAADFHAAYDRALKCLDYLEPTLTGAQALQRAIPYP